MQLGAAYADGTSVERTAEGPGRPTGDRRRLKGNAYRARGSRIWASACSAVTYVAAMRCGHLHDGDP